MPTVVVQVGANADDGYEINNSSWFFNVAADTLGADAGSTYNAGFRFASGFTVPQGSTISSASLLLTINNSGTVGIGTGTVYGNKVGNAVALSSSNRPSQLAQTTASASVSLTGTTQTVDVTAIIQEIVNQGSFASGNAVILFAIASSTGNNYGGVADYSFSPSTAAQLTVTYVGPTTTTTTSTTSTTTPLPCPPFPPAVSLCISPFFRAPCFCSWQWDGFVWNISQTCQDAFGTACEPCSCLYPSARGTTIGQIAAFSACCSPFTTPPPP